MGYGIKLHVWGDYACFTRPEMKAERVSYEVITPSASIGILENIHWKPAIKWIIDKIHVYKPVKYDSLFRNELSNKIPSSNVKTAMNGGNIALHQYIENERQQRNTLLLRDVEYVIEAHFEMTDKAGERDSKEKHYAQFMRRAKTGGFYAQPYFGCREFIAYFELVDGVVPVSSLLGEKDFGFMLHSIDYKNENKAFFYNAFMKDGVIEVPEKAVI